MIIEQHDLTDDKELIKNYGIQISKTLKSLQIQADNNEDMLLIACCKNEIILLNNRNILHTIEDLITIRERIDKILERSFKDIGLQNGKK